MEEINWYHYEEAAAQEGFQCVCGIDGPAEGRLQAPCLRHALCCARGRRSQG